MKSLYEQSGGTYHEENGYLIPDLTVPTKVHKIGKYGLMRRNYLKNHRPGLYTAMLVNGTLLQHLEKVDKEATELIQRIVHQMANADGVTDELKAENQMKWVGLMNNYLHSAEEIILQDLVCTS